MYCMECYAWNVQNEARKEKAKAGESTKASGFTVVKGGVKKTSTIQVNKGDGQLLGWESLFN